jgi:hypothetical protein
MKRLRATLHPILHSRIGPDQFVSRMARLREDPRFKAVQPDEFDQEDQEGFPPAASSTVPPATPGVEDTEEDETEVWFDWAFVDFWKNNYCRSSFSARLSLSLIINHVIDTIQRAIAVEPDAMRGSLGVYRRSEIPT